MECLKGPKDRGRPCSVPSFQPPCKTWGITCHFLLSSCWDLNHGLFCPQAHLQRENKDCVPSEPLRRHESRPACIQSYPSPFLLLSCSLSSLFFASVLSPGYRLRWTQLNNFLKCVQLKAIRIQTLVQLLLIASNSFYVSGAIMTVNSLKICSPCKIKADIFTDQMVYGWGAIKK